MPLSITQLRDKLVFMLMYETGQGDIPSILKERCKTEI
jgi:hypothetical protein